MSRLSNEQESFNLGNFTTEVKTSGAQNGEVDVELIPCSSSAVQSSALQNQYDQDKPQMHHPTLSTDEDLIVDRGETSNVSVMNDTTEHLTSKFPRHKLFSWRKKSKMRRNINVSSNKGYATETEKVGICKHPFEPSVDESNDHFSGKTEAKSYDCNMETTNTVTKSKIMFKSPSTILRKRSSKFSKISKMLRGKDHRKRKTNCKKDKDISILTKDPIDKGEINIEPENFIFHSLSNGSVDVYGKHLKIIHDGKIKGNNEEEPLKDNSSDCKGQNSSATPTTEVSSTEDESSCMTSLSGSDRPVAYVLNVPQISNDIEQSDMDIPNILDNEETFEKAQRWKTARRKYSARIQNMNSVDDLVSTNSMQNQDCVQELTKSTSEIFNDACEACRFVMQYEEPFPAIRRNSTKTTKIMSNRLEDESLGSFAYFYSDLPSPSSISDVFTPQSIVDVSALCLDETKFCDENNKSAHSKIIDVASKENYETPDRN